MNIYERNHLFERRREIIHVGYRESHFVTYLFILLSNAIDNNLYFMTRMCYGLRLYYISQHSGLCLKLVSMILENPNI